MCAGCCFWAISYRYHALWLAVLSSKPYESNKVGLSLVSAVCWCEAAERGCLLASGCVMENDSEKLWCLLYIHLRSTGDRKKEEKEKKERRKMDETEIWNWQRNNQNKKTQGQENKQSLKKTKWAIDTLMKHLVHMRQIWLKYKLYIFHPPAVGGTIKPTNEEWFDPYR